MRVAINGFGRIGRSFLRASPAPRGGVRGGRGQRPDRPADALAHLLTYDTAFGILDVPVSATEDSLVVGGREIRVLSSRDPAELPWRDLGVDVVLESTGAFTNAAKAAGPPRCRAPARCSSPRRRLGEDITHRQRHQH